MNMNKKTLALMEELTQVIGIAGDEREVSKILAKHYAPLCDEIIYDNLGSIFAVKRCGKLDAPKVMISAHMDEVGFMIQKIRDNGLLGIIAIGEIAGQSLHAQRVRIKTKTCEYIGTIVADDDDIARCDVKKMLIDVGATSKEEVLSLGIHLGDSVVLDGPFSILANGQRILSKAWDNRYGCVLSVEILELCKDINLDFDLYVGATVMEEVGNRGAITATGLIQPDLGIVLDCSFARDIKGAEDAVGQLGKGVLIRYYDKGMMPNRTLLQHLVSTCLQQQISHQYYYTMGSTDTAWIHKLFDGCPTLSVCICGRNVHTGNSIIDVNDYTSAKSALYAILQELKPSMITAFKEENR